MKTKPSIQISFNDFVEITKMGVNPISLAETNLSLAKLAQLCFEAGKRSGQETIKKDIRTILGVVDIF